MEHYHNSYEYINVIQCKECGQTFNLRSMIPGLKGMLQIPDYCPYCGGEELEEIVETDQELSEEKYEKLYQQEREDVEDNSSRSEFIGGKK